MVDVKYEKPSDTSQYPLSPIQLVFKVNDNFSKFQRLQKPSLKAYPPQCPNSQSLIQMARCLKHGNFYRYVIITLIPLLLIFPNSNPKDNQTKLFWTYNY
ncbi:transmembrane protein, putative (macronuclear) [Tetrahymena thermophila SB210]|uniref:Transmembrane protein, putative n=1 Tax=Tetrahymena thermophila (strain SB210) TaxID=312017 RepID=Q23Q01_TETTS|nr:transmembrane protein, putative [Tetrahymena thermophila SB210]EAR98534.2 transmembrane protein, putative [Tetrahymena thermophila SB210]|eukprot:XP_001018779.2 transmembrane protein, putative [Tetrahymena thermophila SB210]